MIALKSNRFATPRAALANQWVSHHGGLAHTPANSLKTGVQSQISRVLLSYEVYTTPAGK
jgi:hypothetical protein